MTTRCITCWIHTCCALSSSRRFYQLYASILSLSLSLPPFRPFILSIPGESSNDETLDYCINNAANSAHSVFLSRSLTSIPFLSLSYSFTFLFLSLFFTLIFLFFPLIYSLFLIPSHLLTYFSLARFYSFAHSSFSCSHFPSLSLSLSLTHFLHLLSLFLTHSLSALLPTPLLVYPPVSLLDDTLSWRLAAGRELVNRYRDAQQLGLDEISRIYTRVYTSFGGGCRHSFPEPSR